MNGFISSIHSFGTVDGPGIRPVVFMQGCPLCCPYCHNPETRSFEGGKKYTPTALFDYLMRFKPYFKNGGGVTISGGEPLMQSKFLKDLFTLLKGGNVHTALDTSGCVLDNDVKALLDLTDLCILDIKINDDKLYKDDFGCEKSDVLEFLSCLNQKNIETWVRRVIVPNYSDNVDDLKNLSSTFPCITKVELLPFKKLCTEKYRALNCNFKFERYSEADTSLINKLYKQL